MNPARADSLPDVVAREDDYGVVTNAERIDCVEDFANVTIHFS